MNIKEKRGIKFEIEQWAHGVVKGGRGREKLYDLIIISKNASQMVAPKPKCHDWASVLAHNHLWANEC